ncbi:MAG: putative synthase protein [Polaromonas sp.]|nr:putative synthase protein [Polaromonas sp.]
MASVRDEGKSLKAVAGVAAQESPRSGASAAKTISLSGRVVDDVDRDDGIFEGFTPLTREQAAGVREANPAVSPVAVLMGQMMTGVLVAGAAWAIAGRPSAGWSALYGALSVILPAALFARGLARQQAGANAGALLAGFLVWELIKIGLTVAMLCAAPRLVEQLSWLALLAGFVVTMKVYWVAMWLRLVGTNRRKILN